MISIRDLPILIPEIFTKSEFEEEINYNHRKRESNKSKLTNIISEPL